MDIATVGTVVKSFDAFANAVANGTAFALPSVGTQVTWQTTFGSAPSSCTIYLQTSLDNSTYQTVDTSTSTAGETRTVRSSAPFIRSRIGAIAGGSTTTVQLIAKKNVIGDSDQDLNTTDTVTFNNVAVSTDIAVSGDVTITDDLDADNVDATTYSVAGVAGINATITTAGLVGKTITVTKGIITGFA